MARQNGYWKRHTSPELQRLLLDLDEHGWRIVDPPTYYTALCPCPLKHKTYIHLTPSGGHYVDHKYQWLRNHTCYGDQIGGDR